MDCPHCKVPLMKDMTACPKCKWEIDVPGGGPKHMEWLEKQLEVAQTEEAKKAVEEAIAEAKEASRSAEEIEEAIKQEIAKSEAEKSEFVAQKIEKLKAEGRDGYYEYKVAQIPLRGDITPVQATIDSFSLNGWKIDSYNPSASGGSVMILFSKYNKF